LHSYTYIVWFRKNTNFFKEVDENVKKITNFVLIKPHIKKCSLGTKGEITIRKKRLSKFKKKSKNIMIVFKLVSIWYLLIFTGSYLSTDTAAYFNDVDKTIGSISIAEDYCAEVKNGSDYWHRYCKDNAGIGNGLETHDEGQDEKGKDPDNPGHNKGGCDDHTNAPCSEVTNLKVKYTSNSVKLTWTQSNGSGHVNVYREEDKTLIGQDIKNGDFVDQNLLPATKYTYRITTINTEGKESPGVTIEVTTSNEVKGTQTVDINNELGE
jgi:predicted ribosomally synthesized peptide with SipW-like signal peptide